MSTSYLPTGKSNSSLNSGSKTFASSNATTANTFEKILLPSLVVQKPVAVHEEIRRELVEEIQPIVNVEKMKTEVHQVTQPLFDREVKPVMIAKRTLDSEYLPDVSVSGRGMRAANDTNTITNLATKAVTIEKPAQYFEVDRTQIIEEIQPVIYKETIVPSVIQETKPMFQRVVEGPVFTQTTLPLGEVANKSRIAPSYVPDMTVRPAERHDMMLPVKTVEKPLALHETIRRERIEEIQPIMNTEVVKTEVHQITQPLFDKEVKPVVFERRTLSTEVLPEVLVDGRGARALQDVSTTSFSSSGTVIEMPAQFIEVERTQIIEEIQPVIYKETIVPSIIQETKPIYQKVVEGPVYSHETLAPQSLSGSRFKYPANFVSGASYQHPQ